MKTKLLIMTLLIGCGDKEQVTATTATPTATTKEVETVDTTTETKMVEVKEEVTEENSETVITNDNTTNVEGENND